MSRHETKVEGSEHLVFCINQKKMDSRLSYFEWNFSTCVALSPFIENAFPMENIIAVGISIFKPFQSHFNNFNNRNNNLKKK